MVDGQTRHLTPARAAEVVVAESSSHASKVIQQLHKMDSTLRGNWAHELVALSQHNTPIVVVPAFPSLGRTCRGGVVRAGGLPVHQGPAGTDPLTPVTTSRPKDMLEGAGATHVVELESAPDLAAWLRNDRQGIAVCDADDNASVELLARAWSDDAHHVQLRPAIFAGTAFSVAAAVAALGSSDDDERTDRDSNALGYVRSALRTGVVLVVCGSLHTTARAQLRALQELASRSERPSHFR